MVTVDLYLLQHNHVSLFSIMCIVIVTLFSIWLRRISDILQHYTDIRAFFYTIFFKNNHEIGGGSHDRTPVN